MLARRSYPACRPATTVPAVPRSAVASAAPSRHHTSPHRPKRHRHPVHPVAAKAPCPLQSPAPALLQLNQIPPSGIAAKSAARITIPTLPCSLTHASPTGSILAVLTTVTNSNFLEACAVTSRRTMVCRPARGSRQIVWALPGDATSAQAHATRLRQQPAKPEAKPSQGPRPAAEASAFRRAATLTRRREPWQAPGPSGGGQDPPGSAFKGSRSAPDPAQDSYAAQREPAALRAAWRGWRGFCTASWS